MELSYKLWRSACEGIWELLAASFLRASNGPERATVIQSSALGLTKTGVASAVSKRGIPRGFVSSISAAAIRLISVSKRNARRRSAHSIRKMVGCRFSTIRWITMPSEYCPLAVLKRTRSPRENGRFMVSPSWRKWSRQCIVRGVLPLRMLPEQPLLSGPILKNSSNCLTELAWDEDRDERSGQRPQAPRG